MSAHWRLAIRYAAWVSAGSAVISAAIWYLYGVGHAGALLYGVGVGLVSFVSTAFTASMLAGGSKAWQAGAALSSIARYGFAAVALGVPAYLAPWPVLTMLGGFASVYLAENVLLLPGMLRLIGGEGARRPERKRVQRRAGS